jgi:hypothetical protein
VSWQAVRGVVRQNRLPATKVFSLQVIQATDKTPVPRTGDDCPATVRSRIASNWMLK